MSKKKLAIVLYIAWFYSKCPKECPNHKLPIPLEFLQNINQSSYISLSLFKQNLKCGALVSTILRMIQNLAYSKHKNE